MASREQHRSHHIAEEGRLLRLLSPECPLTKTEERFLKERYGESGLAAAIKDLMRKGALAPFEPQARGVPSADYVGSI